MFLFVNFLQIFLSLLFFYKGTINNLGYVVVNTLGQQIVGAFHKEKLLGLVLWFNAGFGFFIRLFHSAFMLKMSFHIRVLIASIVYLCGVIGCAFSTYVGIVFAFVCIVLVGGSSNFGERFVFYIFW